MKKSLARLILIVIIFAGIGGTGSYLLLLLQPPKINESGVILNRPPDQLLGWKYPVALFPEVGPISQQIAYSSIRDPGGIPQGLPIRLKIPVIGVDSIIEDALITPDGRMDVPYGSINVAWFSLGPNPGWEGSAVIGGHFGINNGVKFVFYDLDKLVIDDKIYIENDKGDTLAFQVRKIELFDRDADATTVFTSNDGLAHLNLITCEGVWNKINDTYPKRRVVFTDAISAEDSINVTISAFSRSLDIGMQGTDVAELQTILEQKGFLKMPHGIDKGYFGSLTRVAVTKYQISVGLPSTGFFGPLTKAKLIPTKPVPAFKPTLPSTAIKPFKPNTLSGIIVGFLKSLYATPVDGIITSFLFLLIVFTIFKIIKIYKKDQL